MVNQVAKMSKNRAQIVKMLWNKQNAQVAKIIKDITASSLRKQKNLLESSKQLHNGYQAQIVKLRNENQQLSRKLDQESTINKAIVNTLRCSKRRLKRYQLLIRKLGEFNANIKQENLILIQQNTRMIINSKEISQDQAKILTYRILQAERERQKMRKNPKKMKKVFNQIKNGVKRAVDQQVILDLQQKKSKLYSYLVERTNKYPQQKHYIKQSYFSDQDDGVGTIESFLKQLINTKQIESELGCESESRFTLEDAGVNTDYVEQNEQYAKEEMKLCFDMGIQVNTIEKVYEWTDSRKKERQKLIQLLQREKLVIVGQNQDSFLAKNSIKQLRERQGKVRNSLIILQMQKRDQFHRVNQQRDSKGRKSRQIQQFQEQKKSQMQKSNGSILEKRESQKDQIAVGYNGNYQRTSRLSNFYFNNRALNTINQPITLSCNMMKKISGRKSKMFQQFLKELKASQEDAKQRKLKTVESQNLNSDNPLNQILKQAESMEDKISKVKSLYFYFLQKNGNAKAPHNVEKYMNKIIVSIFKNLYVSKGKPCSFVLQFLDVMKTTYGKVKGFLNKFLNYVAVINKTQSANHLMKIVSLLLGINNNLTSFEVVNGVDVCQLYFKMFFALSVKCPSESAFNPWRCKTTISKITNFLDIKASKPEQILYIDPPALGTVLKQFMSQNKQQYLNSRMNQFICSSNLIDSTCFEENKSFDSNSLFVDLNQVLLYVLEVYLIEKKNYYDSYHQFIEFLAEPATDQISLETFVFLLDIMGYSEQQQTQMLAQIFDFQQSRKIQKKYSSSPNQNNQSIIPGVRNKIFQTHFFIQNGSKLKADRFYMLCVKHDFPLFQQLKIAVHEQFIKEISQENRQKYYKRLKFQDWNRIHKELKDKLKDDQQNSAYFKIIDKLDSYLTSKKQENDEVFSILYKIILLQAIQYGQQKECVDLSDKIKQISRNHFEAKALVNQYNIYSSLKRIANQPSVSRLSKNNELSSILMNNQKLYNQISTNIAKPKYITGTQKYIQNNENIDIGI